MTDPSNRFPRATIDLFDPAVIEDPLSAYEEIRAAGRVVWSESLGGWLVTGFDDCMTVLKDAGVRFRSLNGTTERIPYMPAPNMIMVDPPEHERYRRVLAPSFAKREVAKWEPRVREVVDDLLTPLRDGPAEMDLVEEFTMIPTIIVGEMLGVEEERHADFRQWAHTIVSKHSYGREDADQKAQMLQASAEMSEYLSGALERRRREPHDDVLGALVRADELTDLEICSAGILLMTAGFDTTAQLLGNALVLLERFPEQRRIVADDPSLVPNMVEEVLRWLGVAQLIPRKVVSDTMLADTAVAEGDTIFVVPPAAGHDPAHWTEPNTFDVRRSPRSHFGFGFGPHLCLGAPVARLEAKIAISSLLEIAPEYSLGDVGYGTSLFARGPVSGTIRSAVAVG